MSGLIFRQLFEHVSSTYTYLLACSTTRQALIIDPVIETVSRDAELIEQLNLKLVYAANTHVHADHVTGTGELKKRFPSVETLLSVHAKPGKADYYAADFELLKFGKKEIEVRSTPGHTDGCVTYVLHSDKLAFTGDALLIRGCGRTDFQQGDPAKLYESVHKQILSLPNDYLLYPAHDYKGRTCSSVDEEAKHNARLTKPKDEFVHLMNNLNLPYPKQIEKSVPANLVCGVYDLMDEKTRAAVAATAESSD